MTRWTAEELNVLTVRYGSMPLKELQARFLPRRTCKSISVKAGKLGLTETSAKYRWSADDRRTLLEHIDMTPKQLRAAFFPNKSYEAVYRQKFRMKHAGYTMDSDGPRTPWTDEELAVLDSLYGTMPVVELRERHLRGRSVRCIQQTAYVHGLGRPNPRTWSELELEILLENYGKMPTAKIQRDLLPWRSRRAVENKISALGIRVGRTGRNHVS